MMQSIKIDIIYFKVDRDTKMEFRFNDFEKMPIRTLATSVKERDEFLYALKRGVYRSDTVIVVGGMNGNVYLPGIIGAAIGAPIEKLDYKMMGFEEPERPLVLPKGSIPLVTEDDEIGGMLLEKGRQSIIVLSEDATVRHKLLDELVFPYIFDSGAEELSPAPAVSEPVKPAAPKVPAFNPNSQDIFSSSAMISAAETAEEIAPEMQKTPEEKPVEAESECEIEEQPEETVEPMPEESVAEPEREQFEVKPAEEKEQLPNISDGMFVITPDEDDDDEEELLIETVKVEPNLASTPAMPYVPMKEINLPETQFTTFVEEDDEDDDFIPEDEDDDYTSGVSFAKVLGVIVALLCIGAAAAIISMVLMDLM